MERSRHLLVVGADPGKEEAFIEFARAHVAVTLVTDQVTSYSSLVEHTIYAPLDGVDSWLDRLPNAPDGVLTLSDLGQIPAAHIAEKLRLPGSGLSAAQTASSKLLQRGQLERSGLAVPRFSAVETPEDVAAFMNAAPGSAILKPPSSSASTAVSLLTRPDQAADALSLVRKLTGRRLALIEEYLPGQEVSVEGVVVDGVLLDYSVTEKIVSSRFVAVEARHTVRSPREQVLHDAAGRELARVVDAVSLRTGITHAEFKIYDGRWTLVEIAMRLGGGRIPTLTRLAGGLDLNAAALALAMGHSLHDTPAWRTSLGETAEVACAAFLAREGLVRRTLDPVAVAVGLKHVRWIQQLVPAGRRVRLPLANWGRSAVVLASGSLDEESDVHGSVDAAIARVQYQLFGEEQQEGEGQLDPSRHWQ